MNAPSIDSLIKDLSNARSSKRRVAAIRLRKLRDPSAGPAIEAALKKEVQDPRTWETQYQMIMALGESQYESSIPLLRELSILKHEYMVYVAIGDALIRLNSNHEKELLRILSLNQAGLTEGALRAGAMLHLSLSMETIEKVIMLVTQSENEQLQFWAAAAAAGWDGAQVQAFLRHCIQSERKETRAAAQAAMEKKFLKWNPL